MRWIVKRYRCAESIGQGSPRVWRATISFAAAAAFSFAWCEMVIYAPPTSASPSRPGGGLGPYAPGAMIWSFSPASYSSTQLRKARNRFVLMN